MGQILEQKQENIIINIPEIQQKINLSKIQQIKDKIQKSKDFAKKHEHIKNIEEVKNRLNAYSYGINFRNH